jgi:hypothetical protein
VRVLSVKQPWASLIASGRKSIELRSWSTKYRGPVLILAGSGVWRGTEHPIGPRGVALCVVDLVDVRAVNVGDGEAACIVPSEDFGFAWVLANPRSVRQVPAKGRLGLYAPSSELLEAIA